MSPNQALVFGASGIGGWAIIRECLSYPHPDSFEHVVGLTHSPMSVNDLWIDEKNLGRVTLSSGIDLTQGAEAAKKALSTVPKIENTTHVFYTAYGGHAEAYASKNVFGHLTQVNRDMVASAVAAVTELCPNLKFWLLQTGGKAYGYELMLVLGKPSEAGMPTLEGLEYKVPLTESNLPIPEPYGSMLYYNAQHDELASRSKGQKWSFCETIPGVISGFTHRPKFVGLVQLIGLWLALYADVHGKGAGIAFPGPEMSFKAKSSDIAQDELARFSIYAALHPEKTAGERFNIADEDGPVTYEQLWPGLCGFFGLKGLPPRADDTTPKGADWVLSKKDYWATFEDKHGLQKGIFEASQWPFMTIILCYAGFDRHYDMSKTRATGFAASSTTLDGYLVAFERMRKAKMIP